MMDYLQFHRRLVWAKVIVIFIYVVGTCNSLTYDYTDTVLKCPDGWSSYPDQGTGGPYCNKLFETSMTWWDAQNTCKLYGAALVNIYGWQENEGIANYVQALGGGQSSWWIGNHDGMTNWDKLGYWSPYQPPPTLPPQSCPSQNVREDSYYFYSWDLADCRMKKPFVCQTTACIDGYFRCANGRCIRKELCDGENDCGDFSDEGNCPGLCKHLLEDLSGTITQGTYTDQSDCQWTIAVPVGYRVKLVITSFVTEKDLDDVQIWAGGMTESTSTLLTHLSGNRDPIDLPAYHSPNNFMIIKFRSDSTVAKDGFTAQWTSELGVPASGAGFELVASATLQFVESPIYEDTLLPMLRETWTVTAGVRQIITLQILDLDLGPTAYVEIIDGSSIGGPTLTTLRGEDFDGIFAIMSASNELLIYLHSEEEYRGDGFKFSVIEGCKGDIVAKSGSIVTPAYDVLDYPSFQDCEWKVLSGDPEELRIDITEFDLADDKDILKIYDGVTDAGTLLTTLSGADADPSGTQFSSPTGNFFVTFSSSATDGGKGFRLDFSTGCDDPEFNSDTLTSPDPLTLGLGDQIVVSCLPGYYFAQVEHANTPTVTIECERGGWNVGRIPQCERVYCGLVDNIVNAYISASTGAEYMDTVTYSCLGGFSAQPSDTVTCGSDGQWSTLPTCQASQCVPIGNVNDGSTTALSGDGTSHSSRIEVTCDPGFEVVGEPILLCDSGEWSAAFPTCQELQCYIPPITNANPHPALIDFGANTVISCVSGYELAGAATITCGTDQSPSSSPSCTDENECDTLNGGCTQQCINTEGSYECDCNDGYAVDAGDASLCNDINECLANGGLGDCEQGCTDSPAGSYTCDCDTNTGYTIYTADGTEGFSLPPGEDGTRLGDTYYIDHSCVPMQCPAVGTFANQHLLTSQQSFHTDDTVYFHCDLGYVFTAHDSSVCTPDGSGGVEWVPDISASLCTQAMCTIPSLAALTYAPVIEDGGTTLAAGNTVSYGTPLTFTCTQHQPSPLEFDRDCVYDPVTDTYVVNYDFSKDCPIIDCGAPASVPGSTFTTVVAGTTLGSKFTVACDATYTQDGNTDHASGGTTVECELNGNWNFGTIECIGPRCIDPGTPLGATQVSTSYAESSEVTYTCDRPGYTTTDVTLTCSISGGVVDWDDAPPLDCVDTTDPTFDNCPVGDITIPILTAAGYPVIAASDNSGRVASLMKSPSFTSPTTVLEAETIITYTATDAASNLDACSFTVKIQDEVAPVITCPAASVTEDITAGPVTLTMGATDPLTATATDSSGETPPVTYSPATLALAAADADTYHVVTATATDTAGNAASCRFMVYVEATGCQDWVLPEPRNGGKSCTETGGIWTCELTCDSGYYFYDAPYEVGTSTPATLTYTCNAIWSPSAIVPDCILAEDPRYITLNEMPYSTLSGGNIPDTQACKDVYKSNFLTTVDTVYLPKLLTEVREDLIQLTDYLPNNDVNDVYLEVVADVDHGTTWVSGGDPTMLYAQIKIAILPTGLKDVIYQNCRATIVDTLNKLAFGLPDLPLDGDGGACPDLEGDVLEGGNTLSDGLVCEEAQKLVEATDGNLCLDCPYGTYWDGATCSLCAPDEYADDIGMTSCTSCPPLTGTRTGGATSSSDCEATCFSENMRSISGFAPCTECAIGSYATDSTSACTTCAGGQTTASAGSANSDDCLDACAPGFFSPSGFPIPTCRPCPEGFYQDTTGATTCKECATGEYSPSESDDVSDCIDDSTNQCGGANPCQNGGGCTVDGHVAVCACTAGYTGQYCDTKILFCDSDPCYYGGACAENGASYTCTCPTGHADAYTGSRCEGKPDECAGITCQNGGVCKDLVGTFECLCDAGFTGTNCETTTSICTTEPCANAALCVSQNAIRRTCNCPSGFTGSDCSVNIDECFSDPCLHGGTCADLDNDYRCDCRTGYTGKNCETWSPVCDGGVCSGSGTCISDHISNSGVCVCAQGYQRDPASTLLTWLESIMSVSIGACGDIDHCGPDPCTAGQSVSCVDGTLAATCSCVTGYDGATCQHDIDDCDPDPCQNDADCTDDVDGYTCSCTPGWTGADCDLDIDECSVPSYPCTAQGTDTSAGTGCNNLPNAYSCDCLPGYTGQDCGTDIDECDSNPCLHNGVCDDGIDTYTCDCEDGWTGPRCETVVDNCNPDDPCQNAATCENSFNDYYCRCVGQDYGKDCDLMPSMCASASPCVDPESTCSEDAGGDNVQCECSAEFDGVGCELATDYCAAGCENGGMCKPLPGGYECLCPHDFEGDRCEESVDDCAGVTCAGSGVCVDMVGAYFCECPLDFDGPDCDKPIDTDYDFLVYSTDGTGMATQAYPFTMASSALSVGMWVKYAKPQSEGTFFTLFGLGEQYQQGELRELISLDETHVTLSFGGGAPVQEEYTIWNINDGEWYFIVVRWDGATGEVQVRVNSVNVATFTNYGVGVTLPDYGWIVLGSEFDAEEHKPEMGEGFQGEISQVNVWDRTLDTNNEIPGMSNDRKTLVSSGLLARWKSYVLEGGVVPEYPSDAGDPVCPEGFTGPPDCTTPATDKTPPEITCPENIKMQSNDRLTQVTWTEPAVSGAAGSPKSHLANGRVFLWGRYANTYFTFDEAGNGATCTFDIFIRNEDCTEPASEPVNGGAVCTGFDDVLGKRCDVSCDADYAFSVPTPTFFTCGMEGAFNVRNIFSKFEYPSCASMIQVLTNVTLTVTYPGIQACDQVLNVDAFRLNIIAWLELLDTLWGDSAGSAFGGFCKGLPSCEDTVTIETTCAEVERRRKRANGDVTISLTFNELLSLLYKSSGESKTPLQVLLQEIYDNDALNFEIVTNSIPNAIPDLSTLVLDALTICEPGQALIDNLCIDCGVGTYFRSATQTCELCQVATYSDTTRQTECTPCADGETTELDGSMSQAECFPVCIAGSYYDVNQGTCVLCPIGFYQDEIHQFYCKPCEADQTTQDIGTDSILLCLNVCPSGTELTVGNTCKDCERGYYRTLGVEHVCTACPAGFTTADVRSTLAAQCTVPDCGPGTYLDETNDVCKDCVEGTYQPNKWQTSCLSCDPGTSTVNAASDSEDLCLFVCPIGEEEDPDTLGTCRPCLIGFYKDDNTAGAACTPCSGDYITAATGSDASDDCTIPICDAGAQPRSDLTGCELCPAGTYQPDSRQQACLSCAAGSSTTSPGATADTDCIAYCPSGEELDASGACVVCDVGYFKDNAVDYFMDCTLCPVEFITDGTGATSDAECNIANCTEGSYRDPGTSGPGTCVLCDEGYYQDTPWQASCTQCPAPKTTGSEGSTSPDDCLLDCPAGEEDVADACELCGKGYYKETGGATGCDQCPPQFVTSGEGSTDAAECNEADCGPGTYRDTVNNVCINCRRGTYNDKKWQTACTDCPVGTDGKQKTTLSEGSNDADQCIPNCDSGREYDAVTTTCEFCPIGYFRKQFVNDLCEMCPPEFITDNEGATSSVFCDVANCSAGYYLSTDKTTCEPCVVGKYQPDKWQTECLTCTQDLTTASTASTDIADCITDCDAGKEYVAGQDCVPCTRGSYRDKSEGAFCVMCPPDKITATAGATSLSACNIGNCSAGSYIIGGGACQPCADGDYQPLKWQTSCVDCGDKQTTGGTGATSSTECRTDDRCALGTDDCLAGAAGGLCVYNASYTNKYTCVCKPGFSGDGRTSCRHKCDLDYCLNGAFCDRNAASEDTMCQCSGDWLGKRCEYRPVSRDWTPYIIGGVIGGLVFLILMILLLICCYRSCFRSQQKRGKSRRRRLRRDKYYPSSGSGMAPPLMYPVSGMMAGQPIYGSVATSLGRSMHSMTQYDPRYDDGGKSMNGYATHPMSRYMFYEDTDQVPLAGAGMPPARTSVYRNGAYSPYEDKTMGIEFTDDDLVHKFPSGFDGTARAYSIPPADYSTVDPTYAVIKKKKKKDFDF